MAEDFELMMKRSGGSRGCVVAREDLELVGGRSRGGCGCVVVGEGESHVKVAQCH